MNRQFSFALILMMSAFGVAMTPDAMTLVWETDYGAPLPMLAGKDDRQQSVSLSLAFPFFDAGFTELTPTA
jgi:hypothetical protein